MKTRRVALQQLFALATLPWLPGRALASAERDETVLLVASDRMGDPRFQGTVLMVMRHGPGGPLGVILNRPTRFSRSELLPGIVDLPDKAEPVFHGGPVARRTLFYIARFATQPPSVLSLAPGIYMGLDLKGLARVLEAGMKPSALRIYAGYAGWAPGQLERELREEVWHLLPMDPAALFDDQPSKLYPRLKARSQLIPA